MPKRQGCWYRVAGAPTNLVLALLAEFASDMMQARSINQIALSSGKAYANVHATATALIKEDILLKETIGHSHLCRLNLSNDKTLIYLSLLETLKRDELLRNSQDDRLLLARIDTLSSKLGILLAWKIRYESKHDSQRDKTDGKREDKHDIKDRLLIITTTHQPHASDIIGFDTTALPLAVFLSDTELRSTISGKGILLFGHALYVSILKERPQDARRENVRVSRYDAREIQREIQQETRDNPETHNVRQTQHDMRHPDEKQHSGFEEVQR